ncbi:MAG: hypothetical protein HYS62_00690 [Candidatus Aenigmarchaeota archaeon]|nr:hypothetical protein [Candidatus Aenigmarchaeota archaeon]
MKVYITAPLTHSHYPEDKEELIKLINYVDSILKKLKFSTYITYRDFLQWGRVTYNPKTVFEKLTNELKTSDLLLAIHPCRGIGTNIVLGMAAILKKPIIIVPHKDFDTNSLSGLMYRGFKETTKCEIILYTDNEDLNKKLRKAIHELKDN